VTEFSPLQAEIHKLIKSSGPMPVWRYMELCLAHPEHGYYVSRDPLGREGDFTTAPEVSQMFGELLGYGRPRCGRRSGRRRRCGWSNSAPAAAP
jgi:SAM-dependent MidA family methyltransferase